MFLWIGKGGHFSGGRVWSMSRRSRMRWGSSCSVKLAAQIGVIAQEMLRSSRSMR